MVKLVIEMSDLEGTSELLAFLMVTRPATREIYSFHTSHPPRKHSQQHLQKPLNQQLLLQCAGWFFNVQICYEFIECFDSKFTMCIFNGSRFG